MQPVRAHNRWLVGLCFALGLVLAVYPLPLDMRWLRPEFVALVVIYWVMALPHQFGAGMACCVGLAQDVVEGSVLGEHALALVVVAYVCQLSYQRIRNYAIWQQACWVFVLVGIHQIFSNWVQSLSGYSAPPLMFLSPALISALMWPLLALLFEHLRVRFRVT